MVKESKEARAKRFAEESRRLIEMRWDAYKRIQAGGKYAIGDKKIYKALRGRLGRMLGGDREKLARFILLK